MGSMTAPLFWSRSRTGSGNICRTDTRLMIIRPGAPGRMNFRLIYDIDDIFFVEDHLVFIAFYSNSLFKAGVIIAKDLAKKFQISATKKPKAVSLEQRCRINTALKTWKQLKLKNWKISLQLLRMPMLGLCCNKITIIIFNALEKGHVGNKNETQPDK